MSTSQPTAQPTASETLIRVIIGDTALTGRLRDNATARDLIAQLPLTHLPLLQQPRKDRAGFRGSYRWRGYRRVMTHPLVTLATTPHRETSSSTTAMSATSTAS